MIRAAYRPKFFDVLLLDSDNDQRFEIPLDEIEQTIAVIREAARTPALASRLQEEGNHE